MKFQYYLKVLVPNKYPRKREFNGVMYLIKTLSKIIANEIRLVDRKISPLLPIF